MISERLKRSVWVRWSTVLVLGAVGCAPESPQSRDPFPLEAPAHFGPQARWAQGSRPTYGTVELGKRLFEDPGLSLDGQVACASCHRSSGAFADPGFRTSRGVNGQFGSRNTPSLSNLAWRPHFMADGGITHLEILPLAPFTDPTEHALSLNEVVARVRGPRYANDFVRAFGDDSVYSARIFRALMDYQLTLQSTQTRWDRVQMGLASWTTSEEFGARVFAKNCANCHQGAQFSSFAYAQHEPIGSNDQGRSRVTQKPEDFGFFKIPSLRNWKWTPPYGHAGQWPTLEDVLNAFERGANSPLTAQERAGLLAFLESINDDAP